MTRRFRLRSRRCSGAYTVLRRAAVPPPCGEEPVVRLPRRPVPPALSQSAPPDAFRADPLLPAREGQEARPSRRRLL